MVMADPPGAGVIGETTPEGALELRLDESAALLTLRWGWRTVPAEGGVTMINGGRRIEITDLSRGIGSGWLVTSASCV